MSISRHSGRRVRISHLTLPAGIVGMTLGALLFI